MDTTKSRELHFAVPGTLRNIKSENGKTEGFALDVRLKSARGCFLSILNGFYLTVDGVPYGRKAQKLVIHGKGPRSMDELRSFPFEHWDPWETATLLVSAEAGLSAGEHEVTCVPRLMDGYFKASPEWIDTPPPLDMDLSEKDKRLNTLIMSCRAHGE